LITTLISKGSFGPPEQFEEIAMLGSGDERAEVVLRNSPISVTVDGNHFPSIHLFFLRKLCWPAPFSEIAISLSTYIDVSSRFITPGRSGHQFRS
jgi:hypothetical protein